MVSLFGKSQISPLPAMGELSSRYVACSRGAIHVEPQVFDVRALIRTIQRRGFLFPGEVTTRTGNQSSSAARSVARLIPGAPLALPCKPSIAVLPFRNFCGIITGLARIKWLVVIARNSSFTLG